MAYRTLTHHSDFFYEQQFSSIASQRNFKVPFSLIYWSSCLLLPLYRQMIHVSHLQPWWSIQWYVSDGLEIEEENQYFVCQISGPFGFTLIPAWISVHIHYKVQDKIAYPFPNFKCETIEVLGNRLVTWSHILLCMWLLIHAVINFNPCL